jgi:TetR/AcrR family transcriptional repressor of nem operon
MALGGNVTLLPGRAEATGVWRDFATARHRELTGVPTSWYAAVMQTQHTIPTPAKRDSRARLLEAATLVIRGQGYAATSVDEICRAAGVTKGAFFHHFRSKEALAVAAAVNFGETAEALFAGAGYREKARPVDRVLAYIDFRRKIVVGPLPEVTCLFGTLLQEAYASSPAIQATCGENIVGHALTLEPDIAAAMEATGRSHNWTARSLALHIQGVLQGSFILAKATGSTDVAVEMLDHLERYVRQILQPTTDQEG